MRAGQLKLKVELKYTVINATNIARSAVSFPRPFMRWYKSRHPDIIPALVPSKT